MLLWVLRSVELGCRESVGGAPRYSHLWEGFVGYTIILTPPKVSKGRGSLYLRRFGHSQKKNDQRFNKLIYVVRFEFIPISRIGRVRIQFKTNDVKSIPNQNRDGVIRPCLGHRKHTLAGNNAPVPVYVSQLEFA